LHLYKPPLALPALQQLTTARPSMISFFISGIPAMLAGTTFAILAEPHW
jgi:hypothetical protein